MANSFKNYIFDAVYRWATDAGLTPYIVVDTTVTGVHLPPSLSEQDNITLNISPAAASEFSIEENDWLFFLARFSGQSFNIELPLAAVKAIYARETGVGISFTGSQWDDPDRTPPDTPDSWKAKTPDLKIVK